MGWGKSKGREDAKQVIDVEKNYNFQPYSDIPRGILSLQFYLRQQGDSTGADISLRFCFISRRCSCTFSSKVGQKRLNPQRILSQFGFDQGSVLIAGEACFSSIRDSKLRFLNKDRNIILLYFTSQFCLDRAREGSSVRRGVIKNEIDCRIKFFCQQTEERFRDLCSPSAYMGERPIGDKQGKWCQPHNDVRARTASRGGYFHYGFEGHI